MPRASKSQWDFGELFPAEETRRVLTVSELTTQVKRLIEQHLGTLWVTGEITNFRQQSSGHIYFTLKDADTQVACVLFRGERMTHRDLLEDGRKVVLQGEVTVYGARGQYQIIVRRVELQGMGALQVAFEKLKQKLAAEGLFAQDRKRPLPSFPLCVGVVTSPTAAALKDVLHVVQRRNPALRLILAPCRVQGEGAAREIADAIHSLNRFAASDEALQSGGAGTGEGIHAILMTRGGGSLEDLWAFNEEIVVRAIAASAIPVVSAVGHEIDFTLSDFAADVRAATPSAAAEILTEGIFAASTFVREAPTRLAEAASDHLSAAGDGVRSLAGRLGRAHPRRRLNDSGQRLDDLEASMARAMRTMWRHAEQETMHLFRRLLRCEPRGVLGEARANLGREQQRLMELARRSVQAGGDRLKGLQTRLGSLGPEQVLARGYSITTDAGTGKVMRDSSTVAQGSRLNTRLHKGTITSRVDPSSGSAS